MWTILACRFLPWIVVYIIKCMVLFYLIDKVNRVIRTSRLNVQVMALVFPSNIFATVLPTVPTGNNSTSIQIQFDFEKCISFYLPFSGWVLLADGKSDTTKIYVSALQVSLFVLCYIILYYYIKFKSGHLAMWARRWTKMTVDTLLEKWVTSPV